MFRCIAISLSTYVFEQVCNSSNNPHILRGYEGWERKKRADFAKERSRKEKKAGERYKKDVLRCIVEGKTKRVSAFEQSFQSLKVGRRHAACGPAPFKRHARRTVGPNVKTPPKIRLKKIREIDGPYYVCNSLTTFERKTHPPETEIGVNLLKFAWKNSWNDIN